MPSEKAAQLLLRQFSGIDQTTDAAFLDPSLLQSAINFHPDYAFLLQNRRGSVEQASPLAPGGQLDFVRILRAYDYGANPYLFYALNTIGNFTVNSLLNDTTPQTSTTLTTAVVGTMADLVQHGNRVYVCNGNDPMKFYDFATATWTTLSALTTTNVTGASATATAATATLGEIPSGTYSYCWTIYNTSTKKFVSRSNPLIAQINAGNYIKFTAPSTALGANEVYLLFVAPRGLSVEYGYCQTPNGLAASGVYDCNSIHFNPLRSPMQNAATRTGRNLRVHKNRIWMSGDETNSGKNASFLYGTNILIPGLEQAIYDQDPFYPAWAQISISRNDGDEITGHIPVAMRETTQNPSSPMAIFKNASTYLWFGDILDDPNADLQVVSKSTGCIAHHAAVSTPYGVIFPSLDSVYLLRPDTAQLIEIGRPVRNIIKGIPANRRKYAIATYHRGFYKLCYSPKGASTNTAQLWLDMRFGFNPGAPSWWGPHTGCGWDSWTNAYRDSDETDRLIGAGLTLDGETAFFHALDQQNRYTEGEDAIVLTASLKTKALDAKSPFQRKIFTRVRVNALAGDDITLGLQIRPDGGSLTALPGIDIAGAGGLEWETGDFDSGEVGVDAFVEGESIVGGSDPRPRCRYAEFTFTHSAQTNLNLRDFEITFIPVERSVGAAPGDPT